MIIGSVSKQCTFTACVCLLRDATKLAQCVLCEVLKVNGSAKTKKKKDSKTAKRDFCCIANLVNSTFSLGFVPAFG